MPKIFWNDLLRGTCIWKHGLKVEDGMLEVYISAVSYLEIQMVSSPSLQLTCPVLSSTLTGMKQLAC